MSEQTTVTPVPPMWLELVPVPVTDLDRAKAFYAEQLGFVVDVDMRITDDVYIVQLTPPGSSCSILLSTGLRDVKDMQPGAIKMLHLVVEDIAAARDALLARGVDLGAIEDVGGGVKYAWFNDPDGNSWVLQEMPWRSPEFRNADQRRSTNDE